MSDRPTQDDLMMSDDSLIAMLEGALGPELGQLVEIWPTDTLPHKVDAAVRAVAARAPAVVVISQATELSEAMAIAQRFDASHPEVSVLIVAQRSADALDRALRAGARGVIDPAALDPEIREIVREAADRSLRLRDAIAASPATSVAVTNRVIPILAAKGGTGKTTIACNVAVALAELHPGQVVIVDVDLQFGDVTATLGIEPAETVTGTLQYIDQLDATTLKAFLTPTESGHLFVLPAPTSPAQADELTARHIGQILRLLQHEFRFVVVDTSAGIDEMTLEALDVATDLVVLTSMDVPSVRAAVKEIEALRLLGLDRLDWHVVLNRATSKVGLSADDVTTTLGHEIVARIPSTRAIPLSVNHGRPIVETDPRLPAARAITDLARRISGVEDTPRTGFKRWRNS